MIKKIDANKYGVVRYAISSIEDIADLPREVSVGSEAILVNEDGEKKFRLGSDGWVEVVEVKEYDEDKLRDILEDAKVGYGGIEYETLEERLDKDFDNVYSVLDNRAYVEYEGCRITAKDSLNGLQKETVVKGRTFQNLLSAMKPKAGLSFNNGVYETNPTIDPHTGFKTLGMIKGNTIYSLVIEFLEIPDGISTISVFGDNEFGKNYYISSPKTKTRYVVARTSKEVVTDFYFGYSPLNITEPIKFKAVLLEGDHRQNSLEELPYIKGIESVGDKSKNLFDGKTRNGYYSAGEFKVNSSNLANVNPIEIKPNTYYTGSGDVQPRMTIYDADMNFISYHSGTCLSPSNAKYMNIHANGATYFQVEEGTKATDYAPHYDGYKISGKSCGKNLAKTLTKDNYDAKGTGKVIFENNKCIAMDTTGWAGCFISGKESIKVKPNTIYYVGLECEEGSEYLLQTNLIIKCFDRNNNVITTRDGTVSLTNNLTNFHNSTYNNTYEAFLPLSSHFKFVKFSNEVHSVKLMFRPASSLGTITNTFKNIIFVETDKQQTYEPYKESTYSYIIDEPLRSLPNGVCDEIDLEKGIVTRRVGKAVLDGNSGEKWEVWNTGGENVYKFVVPIPNLKLVGGNPLLCNNFKYLSFASTDEEGIYNGNAGRMGLKISKTKLTSGSIDEFREWLTLNPITVWYELETPYTDSINLDEVILNTTYLKSYEPITHITSDNYLLPTIKTQIPSDFNAVVLGLKSNNEALTSQVMSLRQTNDELETTNREQDDVIDVTLLALDEVYGMIDEGEIETMSTGSPMVNVYVKMIKRGIKTLDEVPAKYRAEVEELI